MHNALDRLLGYLSANRGAAFGNAAISVKTISGTAAREALQEFSDGTPTALILVDHAPFACGQPIAELSPDLPSADLVRDRAHLGVLALELSRRASRTLILKGEDTSAWLPALAGLLPYLDELPSDLLAPPSAVEAQASGAPVRLVETYLAPLFLAPGSQGPFKFAWPRESFLDGDAPGTPLPPTVEVAGRARILTYGPYLPLPTGRWRARATLGFSSDIGRMPFILEADTGGAVDRGFFEAERGGIFTVDLDFSVAVALYPVELRIISQDSALEGQLALIEVALEQVPSF